MLQVTHKICKKQEIFNMTSVLLLLFELTPPSPLKIQTVNRQTQVQISAAFEDRGCFQKGISIRIAFACPFHQFLINSYKNLEKQIQFGSMLPDSFPVFNIELQCDFESSDNVFPAYNSFKKAQNSKENANTHIHQEQNLSSFSAIGRRNDNLDRNCWLRLPQLLLVAQLDGHCDPQPANYLEEHLLLRLSQHPDIRTHPEKAILQVFSQLEGEICGRFEKGCTALVVLVFTEHMIVGNLGDSRLFGVNAEGEVSALTSVHNLGNQQQLMQVINRGGIVLKKGTQYRINGQLNLSRAFGDRHLKHCMSSKPDLYRFQKNAYMKWILATDGFYSAKNMEKRMNMSVMELKQEGTVYQDNASAIFLQF